MQAQRRPDRNNINDPQKKHRLGTVSKNILQEGLKPLMNQKTFNVMHHSVLLDKLFDKNINDNAWLVTEDLYQDNTTKIKWFGGLSDRYQINQGGILSTDLFKIYIDPLINILKVRKRDKVQESKQSITTPDPGYQLESDNVTINHHKREPRGQPFPSR